MQVTFRDPFFCFLAVIYVAICKIFGRAVVPGLARNFWWWSLSKLRDSRTPPQNWSDLEAPALKSCKSYPGLESHKNPWQKKQEVLFVCDFKGRKFGCFCSCLQGEITLAVTRPSREVYLAIRGSWWHRAPISIHGLKRTPTTGPCLGTSLEHCWCQTAMYEVSVDGGLLIWFAGSSWKDTLERVFWWVNQGNGHLISLLKKRILWISCLTHMEFTWFLCQVDKYMIHISQI